MQMFEGKAKEFMNEIDNVHMVWLEEIQQEANRIFSRWVWLDDGKYCVFCPSFVYLYCNLKINCVYFNISYIKLIIF